MYYCTDIFPNLQVLPYNTIGLPVLGYSLLTNPNRTRQSLSFLPWVRTPQLPRVRTPQLLFLSSLPALSALPSYGMEGQKGQVAFISVLPVSCHPFYHSGLYNGKIKTAYTRAVSPYDIVRRGSWGIRTCVAENGSFAQRS